MVTPDPVLFPFRHPSFQGAPLVESLAPPRPLLTTSVLGMAAGTQAPVASRHWFSYKLPKQEDLIMNG